MAVERLRVGILCNGTSFQQWQAECIRHVAAEPGVELVVLVVNDGSIPQQRHPLRTTLYRAYRHRWWKVPSMETVDLSGELHDVPQVVCSVRKEGMGQVFSPEDLDRIKAHRPDVLLRFGFNILRGGILELPRYGVWSYHHGDELKYRGGPPGFWEIMAGDPVTGAMLQRLNDTLDGGRILRKGWFSTVDHSLAETVDTVLSHSAPWAAQVCRALLNGDATAAEGTPSPTTAPIHKYPGNFAFLRFLWRQFSNKLRFHRRELKEHEEWNIGVLYQPIHTLLEEKPNLNVQWLNSPARKAFRADPFGYFAEDGQLNVLYERYDRATGKGEINRVRPRRDNILKRSRPMLSLSSHLSYPYVVMHEGKVHVVPENAAGGGVDLYRLNETNEALEHVQRLLDAPLFDPTVFLHEGRWWIMGTLAPLTNVHLVAYHAPSLLGPYTPHVLNPIKTDIRSARPAGTPFVHEGKLYRPSQDSSTTYGHHVVINRVITLTPDTFVEEEVKHLGPIANTAYNQGLHTISAVGDITLVDGKRYVHSQEQEKRVRQRKLNKLKHGKA